MRVMMTGATGFIGYHTAQALMEAGHEVSLLVRNVDKMNKLFGENRIEHYTQGDITDEEQVKAAMEGCDAVIHVAALVSTHAGDAQRVFDTNTRGTRNVIGSAVDLGMERIIHVSSVTALYNPKARMLNEDSPPGSDGVGYGRSKVACEEYVRSLQEEGHPVYITYPASVLGPDAPEPTEPHTGLQTYISKFVPVMSSGNQYVDVRDVAQVHRQIVDEAPPSNRYVIGGHYIPWIRLAGVLENLTGQRIRRIPFSGAFMRMTGSIVDSLSPIFNLDLPLTREGLTYATRWVKMDSARLERELDFEFRPVEETLVDSIRWLHEQGLLTDEEVGKLSH